MMLVKSFQFFVFLFIIHVVICDKCLNLEISIIQKVEQEGFHRDVKWLFETQILDKLSWLQSHCNFVLRLKISPGMFVNPDQIAELNRTGQLAVAIDSTVDVEVAAHEATSHVVFLFLNGSSIKNVSISLPIHLRYQRSQISGGYGKVPLSKPSLLVRCSEYADVICSKEADIEAPCNPNNTRICIWKNISYESLFEETELYVPIGDLDDYPLVSIISLLLGCAGCIYILSVLSMRPL